MCNKARETLLKIKLTRAIVSDETVKLVGHTEHDLNAFLNTNTFFRDMFSEALKKESIDDVDIQELAEWYILFAGNNGHSRLEQAPTHAFDDEWFDKDDEECLNILKHNYGIDFKVGDY